MKNSLIKNNARSFLIIAVFLLVILLLARGGSPGGDFELHDVKKVKLGGETVKVELAVSQAEHEKGLSGRQTLGENEGMLFIFDRPGKYYFWMKGMNFPIDMIWISEDMKIIYIAKNVQPEDFLSTYGPDAPSRFVLEVPAGFSNENFLTIGSEVEFSL